MSRWSVAVAVLSLALIEAGPARAQLFPPAGPSAAAENIEGFTVAGKGSVAARPNRLEIDLTVASASELTADAIVKYRDAKRRLQEAFRGLKLKNVAVEEQGLLVDQKGAMINPYMFDYQGNRRAKTEVQLSRKLVVKCSEIREMDEDALLQLVAKLLDVAQDAGGQVGSGQAEINPYYYNPYQRSSGALVRFVLDDFDTLQEQAYEKAIADAKARARRLAKLSGVELGPIVAVREVALPGEKKAQGAEDEPPTRRLESTKYQEMPIRVELLVRFDVHAQVGGAGTGGR